MWGVANPYHRGHPVVWFLTMVALMYGIWAGGIAWGDIGKCDDAPGGRDAREWHWLPPEWECH